jgi:hypothetical protein
MSARRYVLSDLERSIIERLLPNKPRGVLRAPPLGTELTPYMGRSRGGLTTKIHASGSDRCRNLSALIESVS